MKNIILIIIAVLVGLFVVVTIASVVLASSQIKRMNNYKEVHSGMTTKEMLKLMGKDYEKNDSGKDTRYTWRIKSAKYKGVNKVTIAVKDDKVTDVWHFIEER